MFVGICLLSGSSNIVLDLPVFGKVQGCDLLSLLNLLLVRLDLALQLVNKSLHPFVVLPVLLLLVGQLLDLPLGFPQVLLCITSFPALGIELALQLSDPGVKLIHGLLASFESIGLSLIHTGLDILDLSFQQLALPLQGLGKVLFSTELISKAGSIDHGALSLFLGQGSLRGHLIQVRLKGGHLTFQLLLGSLDALIGAGLLNEGLVGISKLLLNHPASTVSLFEKGAGFLKGILVRIGPAVSSKEIIMSNILQTLFFLELGLGIPERSLIILDGSLGFRICCIGVLEASLKIQNICFQLLLHSDSFSLSLSFGLNSSLHIFEGLVHVLLGGGKLLTLLCKATVNFLLDLSQLQLCPQHLVFFLFESSLSLSKSSLKFHLLSFKTLAGFVNSVYGLSTFSDLIHDIPNFIRKGFVFSSDFLKLKNNLLISSLDLEKIGRSNTDFLLGIIQVHAEGVTLLLHLTNESVIVLRLLLHRSIQDLRLIH